MKTILFLIGLFIINISFGFAIEVNENATTIEDLRLERFSKKPTKSYNEDTDSKVYGATQLYFRKEGNKREEIQLKINNNKTIKLQSSKIKSTYLDFTILQEENIS